MGKFLDQPQQKGKFLDDQPQDQPFLRNMIPAYHTPLKPVYDTAVNAYNAIKKPVASAIEKVGPIPMALDTYGKMNPGPMIPQNNPFSKFPSAGMQYLSHRTPHDVSSDVSGAAADIALGTGASEGVPAAFNAMKKGAKFAGDIPAFVKYGTMDLSPENLTSKAQKITAEILQPSKGELTNSIERGRVLPAVKQTSENIVPVKSYEDLRTHLGSVAEKNMNERNGLLKQIDTSTGNQPIGTGYIDRLEQYIADQESKKLATSSELQQMKDVLQREKDFYGQQPLTRMAGQQRKEDLQNLTQSLLQKTEHGDVIDTQPARNKALNELRRGLKESVAGPYGKITELNSRHGGLTRAQELAAGQEALAQKATPGNPVQKIARFILNPRDIPGAVADAALQREGSLLNKTKKISELVKKAGAPTAAIVGSVGAGTAQAAESKKKVITGEASTYGWGEKLNKHTANGEVFNPHDMTAASYEYPLGTKVKVTDTKTGKSVVVRINDKGPNKRLGRKIDLSQGAWKALGSQKPGLTNVKIEEI